MQKFQLAEITTKDGLIHQGIYSLPPAPGKRALLWVHGLTGKFYGDVAVMNLFASACSAAGFGFASFNNRGHDMIANFRKVDPQKAGGYTHQTVGAGYEVFEDCVFDIEAAISFLRTQGFSEIVLVGHSTGANKVCYYVTTQTDSRVCGVVLAGPLSDRLSTNTDKEGYKKNLAFMQQMIKDGKGDVLLSGYHFFPMTPKRWLSLLAEGSVEDVFTYGDNANVLSRLQQVQQPLLVVLSEQDEVADRPIEAIQKVFDEHAVSTSYRSAVIPGATHSYTGKEKEFVDTVISWVGSL